MSQKLFSLGLAISGLILVFSQRGTLDSFVSDLEKRAKDDAGDGVDNCPR